MSNDDLILKIPFNALITALQTWGLAALRNALFDKPISSDSISSLQTLKNWTKKTALTNNEQSKAKAVFNNALRGHLKLETLSEVASYIGFHLHKKSNKSLDYLPIDIWEQLAKIAWHDLLFQHELQQILSQFLLPRTFLPKDFSNAKILPSPATFWFLTGLVSSDFHWKPPELLLEKSVNTSFKFWEYWLMIEVFRSEFCKKPSPNMNPFTFMRKNPLLIYPQFSSAQKKINESIITSAKIPTNLEKKEETQAIVIPRYMKHYLQQK